ncbi:uncharacterized protein LOC131326521 [Rhododendron vialii]|uniref:uncharacterized protein LOC131326521 n=1 Tax=Rhododendron vialii TaxID=182163 RepID=UPI00266029ED|nr:uncharacterized protein LOC131326521 [Rhododendron vialii]
MKEDFPQLYLRSTQKDVVLSEVCIGRGSNNWDLQFRGRLRLRASQQLEEMKQRLQGVTLDPSKPDSLLWIWSVYKKFSTKSVYRQWELQTQSSNSVLGSLWRNLSPPKVEIFSWLAVQGRIATMSVLFHRNLITEIQQALCPLCSDVVETPLHLLLHCRILWEVWSSILEWWNIQWVCPSSLAELASWWFENEFRNLEKSIWEVCFFAILWSIWIVRNGYVFNNISTQAWEVVDLIKTRVAMWIKAKFDIKVYIVKDFKGYLEGIRKVKL